MKLSIVLSLSILIFMGCSPQATSVLNRGGEFMDPFYVELPFTAVNGKIIVKGKINGKSKRFILDTGSPNIISESLFYELNENIIGETKLKDEFDNSKTQIICEVDAYSIGSIVFKDVSTVVVEDNNPIFDCFEVDGIIGSNMFRNTVLHLDKIHGAVIIASDVSKIQGVNPNSEIEIELDVVSSIPMVMLNLNNKAKARAIFDSGNPEFLSITSEHMDKLKEFNIISDYETAYGYHPVVDIYGVARPSEFQRAKLDKASVGSMDFFGLLIYSIGNADKARLGSELLNYAAVTIDYRKKKMYIKPEENTLEVFVNHKRWPVTPAYFNGGMRVSLVWRKEFEEIKNQLVIGEGDAYYPEGFCNYVTFERNAKFKETQQIITRTEGGEVLKTKLFPY